MKKVVIACSAKFTKQAEEYKEILKKQNYEVINYPKNIDQNNIEIYQQTYEEFFYSLANTDIIFVLNYPKKGISGYIGAETFAELSFVIANNRIKQTNQKIYLLNYPSEEVSCYPEIKNFIKLGWIEVKDITKQE